jgi:outer membrane lipoprotein-sorting protein
MPSPPPYPSFEVPAATAPRGPRPAHPRRAPHPVGAHPVGPRPWRLGTLGLAASLVLVPAAALPEGAGHARADADTGTPPGSQGTDARTVAARVHAFYAQVETTRVAFRQSYYHRLHRRYERSRGELVVAKPGRLRFDYQAPDPQRVVVDGRRVGLRELDVDGSGRPGPWRTGELGAMPAAFGFLSGTADLAREFTFRLLEAERYRFDGDVLELRPRHPDPRYRRVILFVDAAPARAGVVHRVRIDDHDGNVNRFFLHRPRFDRPAPPALFAIPE